MSWLPTAVVRRRSGWTVLVRSTSGERRELLCRSEAQARYFAAVISLGPSQLPAAATRARRPEPTPQRLDAAAP